MSNTRSIRPWVEELVARCRYVAECDSHASSEVSGESTERPLESFRKLRYKQQRSLLVDFVISCSPTDNDHDVVLEESIDTAHPKQKNIGDEDAERTAELTRALSPQRAREAIPLAFKEFVEDILQGEIELVDHCVLSVHAADPLNAISVPSIREGNSLTACCVNGHEQLIVFGGRVLQDVTQLLPKARSIKPMSLERVRYVFSNGVYVYGLEASTWRVVESYSEKKPAPRERSDHTAVFVEPNYLLIFGGRGRNGQIMNDCWVLSLVTWEWTQIQYAMGGPYERYWHGCCVNDESVYVFGGKSDVVVYGELQQFCLKPVLAAINAPGLEAQQLGKSRSCRPRASWFCPHTVGQAPPPCFGLRMITLDDERIAVIGGWTEKNQVKYSHVKAAEPLEMYILDIVAFIWSCPQLSSHVSELNAPSERMLFECFYANQSLIIFGGFSYGTNGETESYTAREDREHVIYTLDVPRMIWRRSKQKRMQHNVHPVAHVHNSSNAVSVGNRCFSCFHELQTTPQDAPQQSSLQLLSFRIQSVHKNATDGFALA